MRDYRKVKVLMLFFLISAFMVVNSQEIGWRGPGRTGIYNETGLLKSWPANGPSLLWEVSGIGMGFGSVTVTDDAVYVTGTKEGKDVLTAFTQDGKKKWEVAYGTMKSNVNYPEARGTATYFNGKLFIVSGNGELTCVTSAGKVAWTINYYEKYSAPVQRFGISENPLIVDNKVIITPGGNKAAMVALNPDNGSVIWETAPLNEGTQYANPLLITDRGMKVIVTHTATNIIGVNAADGKLLWKFNFVSVSDGGRGSNYINTPLYWNGELFAANGYGQTAAKIKIGFDGSAPTLAWKNPEFVGPHVGGMIRVGNYIYSTTHDSNAMGRLICADWNTGKTMWLTAWNNKGSLIAADGLIYFYEDKNGNVALIRPDSEKLDVISSFRVTKGDGPYWSHPVINKGRLFLRHGDYLGVYSIKAN